MTLVFRPPGPGNWAPVFVTIEQSRHSPSLFYLKVGDVVSFGACRLRLVEIRIG